MEADESVEQSHVKDAARTPAHGADEWEWSARYPGAVVHGCFLPGQTWSQAGTGWIWVEHAPEEALATLAERLAVATAVRRRRPDASGMALCLPATRFVDLLVDPHVWQGLRLGRDLELHLRMARLARHLVATGDVLPFAGVVGAPWTEVQEDGVRLVQDEGAVVRRGAPSGTYSSAWIPAWRDEAARALRRIYISQVEQLGAPWWRMETASPTGQNQPAPPSPQRPAGSNLGGSSPAGASEAAASSSGRAQVLVDAWIWTCTDRLTRRFLVHGETSPPEVKATSFRIRYRGEDELLQRWQESLAQAGDAPQLLSFHADHWLMHRMLREEFRESGWSEDLFDDSGAPHYHLGFELIPPVGDASPDWRLRYHVVHRHFELRAPLSDWWRRPDRQWPIGHDLLYAPDLWILPELARAAEVCPAIARTLSQPAPAEALVGPDEVLDLVNHQLPELIQYGFSVHAPDLAQEQAKDVRIRVMVRRVRGRARTGVARGRRESWFDLQRLVDFDWSVVVDDEELPRDQFEALVKEQTPFVRIGGAWKRIPLQAILDQVRALTAGGRGGSDLLQFARSVLMNQEAALPVELEFTGDAAPARHLLDALFTASAPVPRPLPEGFRGRLRDYQQKGFSWLLHLREIGCGGCLADDMGLGKTIQVLAYLMYLKQRQQTRGPHLLICPTSLLPNWRSEIQRFTPSLRIHIHHGSHRNEVDADGRTPLACALSDADLILTTYATCVRDIETLAGIEWDAVILDEAQNIKNTETKQAAAVRKLAAHHRIALTGTPVENRLDELWSIMDFLNPGYLGGLTWFRRNFAAPITDNPQGEAARRLHRLLMPVLLRRRKTDPAIQVELPEKWEVRDTAGLKGEQAALYQSIVNQLWSGLAQTKSDMSRRGRILSALTRLKQVCDHPCLVAGGSAHPRRSGKLSLLLDLIEEVVAEGEASLVFTQFREMGEIICDALAARFGWRPRFLHGGLGAGERGELVDSFQSGADPSPVLVLSLKAGGVGLNLTRANHVFHFDRWWNPAVEDQATDRVFRIGQTKDVQVHKLVCSGTLEERIDEMITSKRQLSAAVVGESEGWITELDDADLQALFSLDVESALGEDD
jgi:hypothetical protein